MRRSRVPLQRLLVDAERRDISEIADLPDEIYEAGLERLRAELRRDEAATLLDQSAVVEILAAGVNPSRP